MSFLDGIFTWGVILALGYAAWKFKVQPELERRKKESSTVVQPKSMNAKFQELK